MIDSDTVRFVRAGYEFASSEVSEEIEEYTAAHSAALFAKARRTGRPYMTAALARINASWGKPQQARALRRREGGFASSRVQPVREQHRAGGRACRRARPLRGDLPSPRRRRIRGFERACAVYRARGTRRRLLPRRLRGALFHELELDEAGRVVRASIMTPTAQNIANLECDMRALAELLVEEGRGEDEIRLDIEKLVRAYDPCLSCGVH